MIVREELGDCSGYEALAPTGSTGITSTLLTPTSGQYIGHNATAAIIVVETAAIRVMLNGDAATTNNGILRSPGEYMVITGGRNVKNFRCMDDTATGSSVKVLVFH